jgi:hypothetical protein
MRCACEKNAKIPHISRSLVVDGIATRSKLAFQGVLKRFGGAGTVTGVLLAHESAKENSILDRELMDMRAAREEAQFGRARSPARVEPSLSEAFRTREARSKSLELSVDFARSTSNLSCRD